MCLAYFQPPAHNFQARCIGNQRCLPELLYREVGGGAISKWPEPWVIDLRSAEPQNCAQYSRVLSMLTSGVMPVA